MLVVDLDFPAEHFADHAEQIADLHGLVAGEHDVLVGVFRLEDFHGAEGRVLDVDVLAQGRGRAVVGDFALFQRLGDEAVDGVAAVGAGAVERAVAQDRVFEAEHVAVVFDVQFAGLFAAPVKAAGLAVYVERAGEDVPLDSGLAAGFEQDDVPEDVDARGFHGFLIGFADVGEAREVEHGVRAAHHGVDEILVEQASRDHFLVGTQVRGGAQVHDGDVVAGFGKLVAHMRSQKAGTAEKHDFHTELSYGLPRSGKLRRRRGSEKSAQCLLSGFVSVRGRSSRAGGRPRRCRRR